MNDLNKPVILVFPFPFLSHYLRCVAFARLLSQDFTILFPAHDKYDEHVLQAGFSVFQSVSFDSRKVMECINRFDFSWLNSEDVETAFSHQCQAIRRYRPVCVVGDNMPTTKMAAECSTTPFVSLVNLYMTPFYGFPRKIPESHFASQLIKLFPSSLRNVITRFGESVSFKKIHRSFALIRKRQGLRRVSDYLEELTGDLTLCLDLPALFRPAEYIPARIKMIGPLIYDVSPGEGRPVLHLNPRKKTLYVNLGSTGDWSSVKQLSDARFAAYNIVTAGDADGTLSKTTGEHHRFLSASEILPHADLVICHGGNGILYQALQFGKPLLCCATNFEQVWNIDAVVRSGLGLSFRKNTRCDDLQSLIERALLIGECRRPAQLSRLIKEQQRALKSRVQALVKSIAFPLREAQYFQR